MRTRVLTIMTLILTPAALMAQWRTGCSWGPGFGGHWGFGGGFFMWITLIVIIGVGVFVFTKYIKNNKTGSTSSNDPLTILKARYARGEITKEDYEIIKKTIS